MSPELRMTLLDLMPQRPSITAEAARKIYDATFDYPQRQIYTNNATQRHFSLTIPTGFLELSTDDASGSPLTIYAPNILNHDVSVTITPTGDETARTDVTYPSGKKNHFYPPRRVARILTRAILQ